LIKLDLICFDLSNFSSNFFNECAAV